MGRDEVLQHGKAFAEIGRNRGFDDFARGLRHQSAHPGELANLLLAAAGARIGHDEDRVEFILACVMLGHLAEHLIGDPFGNIRPDVDDLVVAFAVGDGSVLILFLHLDDALAGAVDQLALVVGNDQVLDTDGNAGLGGMQETQILQVIKHLDGDFEAEMQVTVVHQLLESLALHQPVDEGHALGQDRVENQPPDGGIDELMGHFAHVGAHDRLVIVLGGQVHQQAGETVPDRREPPHHAVVEGEHRLIVGPENPPLPLRAHFGLGQVVAAQHDVLAGYGDRLAIGRRQDILRAQHQHRRLDLRLRRQRNVHRHLVAIEVGVEGGADQGRNLDGLALDQDRLEGLNAEAVQRRGAIEHDRVILDHFFQDIPYNRFLALHHFLGALDSGRVPFLLQAVVNERLEQLESHFLGQAALVQFQFGPDDDHGPARVIDAFAEQVLAEAPRFTLQRVAE